MKCVARITAYKTQHNDRLDKAIYVNMSSLRRFEDPVLLALVDIIVFWFKVKANHALIMEEDRP
ncbi:hypothetical protein PHMEG_0006004 [Phytophthora megakarya]|uniref:Uncharacterized protein n=1 Tax=Phytophthora megakarya TaxID=4795 RepID=A0A225WQ81_9STRA|nr:hypothetical protein PHMEG_0006004 [Phytophthora megakarya]